MNINIKLVQCFCAIVWCLLAAGPIFGFAALKPILISEGVYSEVCKDSLVIQFNDLHLGHTSSETILKPCIEQDLKLNFIFTVSAGITNVIALIVGWILDHQGPRICGFIGSFFLMIGTLLLAWSQKIEFIDPYLTGYSFLAVGGPFVFISTFQLAKNFPQHSGTILSLLTGAFDSSSSLFLLYKIIYENWAYDLSLQKFFTAYLAIPCFIIICQLFIMPCESYKTLGILHKLEIEGLGEYGELLEGDDGSRIIPDLDERLSLLSGNLNLTQTVSSLNSHHKSFLESYVEAKLKLKSGGIFGILHGYPVLQQVFTPWFLLMLIFTTVSMLRINYFVATVRSQEEYMLGNLDISLKIGSIFDILLPVGGLVSIPFIGLILDNYSILRVLILLSIMSILMGLCGLFHSFTFNLIGICLFVIFRPFYYTVLSDYCSKVFGFDTFGTIYGLIVSISGLFNMTQTILDKLTHNTFEMNPVPVNIGLISISAVSSLSLILFVKKKSNKQQMMMNTTFNADSMNLSYTS